MTVLKKKKVVRKKTTKKKVVKKKAPKKKTTKPINTPEKYVFGRPTKYNRDFPEQVFEACRKGELLTTASICCFLDIDRSTFYDWLDKHEDFSNSIKRAKEFRMKFMEQKGLLGITQGKTFNGIPWLFLMKNMFPEEYRDRHEIEHGNKDDKAFTFAFDLSKKPTHRD